MILVILVYLVIILFGEADMVDLVILVNLGILVILVNLRILVILVNLANLVDLVNLVS